MLIPFRTKSFQFYHFGNPSMEASAASLFGSFEVQSQTTFNSNSTIGLSWQQQLSLCDSQNAMDDQEDTSNTSLGI